MPSKSIAQQHLMQAAEHGADFPMAKKLRQSMSHDQLHDFAVGSEAGKPEHVSSATPHSSAPSLLAGNHIAENMNAFKARGQSEYDATRSAMAMAPSKPKRPRHENLGKFLHPRKDGKPHGSDKL